MTEKESGRDSYQGQIVRGGIGGQFIGRATK